MAGLNLDVVRMKKAIARKITGKNSPRGASSRASLAKAKEAQKPGSRAQY